MTKNIFKLLIVICIINNAVYSKSANINDTLKAYQNLYGKYLISTTVTPPLSIFAKGTNINLQNTSSTTKNNEISKIESYNYNDDDNEFKEQPDHSNPLVTLEKLLIRVQRDIAIKKRSVENVLDTDMDKDMNTENKKTLHVVQEAYRNNNTNILLKNKNETNDHICEYTPMGEFPNDLMTDYTRQNGGFLIHIIIFVYLSIVLAFICDKYFLKSLEYICENLSIPSDVGGATFMAIGTSAPELFTSIIGVFISDNDIGTGTIVGSAVFNLLVIPGACGYAAYKNLSIKPKITPFPILRDTIFYILTIITLILCLKDNQVDWIESTTLLGLYAVYIVVMYFNAQISNIVSNKYKNHSVTSSLSGSPFLKGKQCHQCSRNKGSLSSISNSDSGLDYKTTKKSEMSPLLGENNSNCQMHKSSSSPLRVYESMEQTPNQPIRRSVTGSDTDVDYSRIRLEQTVDGKFKEISPSRSDSGADSNSIGSGNIKLHLNNPNVIDNDWTDNTILDALLFPFRICFWITLPRPSQFMFALTFLSSIIWIALLSYVIVWMITILGITFGIPDTVAGMTVLAAGTSIPELISSYLLVKKAGLVDMALCNSIGSNIFDILFCLGLPWLLRTMVTMLSKGFGLATLAATSIHIRSTALPFTSLILLLTVMCMLIIFKITKWKLGLKTAVYCLMVYFIFILTTTMLELNV